MRCEANGRAVTEPRVVALADVALVPEAPGIASRAVGVGGTRRAMVECGPGVLHEEWCAAGRSGSVLAGEVTYEFEGGDRGPLRATASQGFRLTDEGSRHRGRAGPDGARLFLIDRAG
jgi:hypothetical protein